MGGNSSCCKRVPGVPLASADDIPIGTRCLQHQCPLAALVRLLHDIFAMSLIDLLVGYTEKTQFTAGAAAHRQQRLYCVNSRENTALHVAYARTIDSVTLNP